jgi:hypothetical protein
VGVPKTPLDPRSLELIEGVREVIKISEPYKLVGAPSSRRTRSSTSRASRSAAPR